ncbi:MAG: ribonuclease III [bacterium]
MRFLKKYNLSLSTSKLLNTALMHSSYSYENKIEENYERLEFLGDAVLQLVISNYLYKNENLKEGEMSKKRASFVCEAALDYYSQKIGLKPYIKVGRGQEVNDTICADIFEAIIAAIYLERGFDSAKEFIHDIVVPEIKAGKHFFDDYKSLMQEYCQTSKQSITYKLVSESGDAHDKTFVIDLIIDNIVYGRGTGRGKKEAEQRAAKIAYEKSVKG